MNKRSFGWFLFGLGGQLQIIASLSLTEAFVLVAALCLFAAYNKVLGLYSATSNRIGLRDEMSSMAEN